MKQIKIIGLLIMALTLQACPNCEKGSHQHITFINRLNSDIVCQRFLSRSITNIDTLFQCRKGAIGIFADSLYHFESGKVCGWEATLSGSYYILFSVMDAGTYDKYIAEPCDTIRKYVPILHRYQLTLEDLQRMNWTVVYPPEE